MFKNARNVKNKVQHMRKAEELYPLETPQELWQEISINIIRPLSKSNNKNTIVIIVDQFTNTVLL